MKKIDRPLILSFIYVIILSFFISAEEVKQLNFEADKIEYIFKKGKEQTICTGNAKIWRDDFILYANLIKIYGKNNDYSEAYRKVKIISIPDEVIITGDYAEFDNLRSYAKVFKNPVLEFTNRNLRIESAVMESYFNENKAIALGEVKITQTNYTAYCEKGIYFKDKNIIELIGNPVVYYGDSIFKGNKIIVYINEKKVKLYGEVEASIKTEEKD